MEDPAVPPERGTAVPTDRRTPTGKRQKGDSSRGTPSHARGLVWSHKNNSGRSDAGSCRRRPNAKAPAQQGVLSSRRRPDSKAAQPQETGSTTTNRPNHKPPAGRGRPVGLYSRIGLSPALRERVPIGRIPLGRVAIGRVALEDHVPWRTTCPEERHLLKGSMSPEGRHVLEAGDGVPATRRGRRRCAASVPTPPRPLRRRGLLTLQRPFQG
jgi:hypothetical protein